MSDKQLTLFKINVFLIYIIASGWLLAYLMKPGKSVSKFYKSHEMSPSFGHKKFLELFYQNRKYWQTSNLGSILLKNKKYRDFRKYDDKKYEILMWTPLDSNRHGNISRDSVNVLFECPVKNCHFYEDRSLFHVADAVVVNLVNGDIPRTSNRNPDQRWILYSEEPPTKTFKYASKKMKYYDINNLFNWSMTYRSDADIPIPLGRFVPRKIREFDDLEDELDYVGLNSLIPHFDKKLRNVLVAVLVTNCKYSKNNEFIDELRKYIDIEVFTTCFYPYSKDCYADGRECLNLQKYLYVFIYDEPKCDDYLSLTVYHYALYYGAVPVIRGLSQEALWNMLPPTSFLNADDLSPYQVADLISRTNYRQDKLLSLHIWRNDMELVMEHGYFGPKISPHYCRICEALNYNSRVVSVYHEGKLRKHLDPEVSCSDD